MDNDFSEMAKSLDDVNLDEIIKEEVAKELNVPKRVLDDIEVKYRPLPYIHYFEKAGKKVYRKIGKILGAYNPRLKEIYIDIGLKLKSLFNPESLIAVKSEEYSHAAQDHKGKLKPRRFWDYLRNYSKDINEIEAKRVADKVTDRIMGKYFGGGSISLY